MTRIVMLRLGGCGEPNVGNRRGVLSFPSVPPDPARQPSDPLFCVRLYIEAGSEITNDGTIWTDVPTDGETPYLRSKYYGHPISDTSDRDTWVDMPVFQPGSYCYYVSYNKLDGKTHEETLTTTSRFHFVVPPSLSINGQYLPLNCVTMQSVISKWVGPDLQKDWPPLFEAIEKKGYNMIHFTPLQVRGESNSPYSLGDQLAFDPVIFKNGEADVRKMVTDLEQTHGVLSMTDMVFNHTANNSDWLREHPDAGYNMLTAPHLEAAIKLDGLLLEFSKVLGKSGYPTLIQNTSDLLKVMDGIKIHVLGTLQLWQYYVLDVDTQVEELKAAWTAPETFVQPTDLPPADAASNIQVAADYITDLCAAKPFGLGARFGNKLDTLKFAGVLAALYGQHTDIAEILPKAHSIMDSINMPLYREYDADNQEILENLYNRINYQRLDPNGLRMGEITPKSPLTEPYFTRFTATDGKDYQLANNGWIWGGNPLVDFASSQSKAYLRREVIVWGDCVKLRYGAKPEDSPYLWEHMTQYVQKCASIFHGFRIDNCHSTPIHVGEALLDAARLVRPDLYVVAELFTGNEDLDIIFVEHLGISSLIREAMQAYNVAELSRLVHMHGGRPIGSFRWLPLDTIAYPADPEVFKERDFEENHKKSEIPVPEMITSVPPHALFMDCTHDNEMPNQKRTPEDTLPNAALVAFCSCATGSTMGYDECYPHLLDVVNEKRLYTYGVELGISKVKRKLNKIRRELALQSCDDLEANEMHVHHEGQYITVNRVNAKTGLGYFLITRTKFYADGNQKLSPIVLHGTVAKPEFGYTFEKEVTKEASVDPLEETDDTHLKTVPMKVVELEDPSLRYDPTTHTTTVTLPENFPQGSILVLSTQQPGCDSELDKFVRCGAIEATKNLSLTDLNALLYKCETEERDSSAGNDGVYNIPDFGHLVYAGIQGWVSVLRDIIANNDLSHPLSEHLRQGTWALDYIPNRMTKFEAVSENGGKGIDEFRKWIISRFTRVKKVPFFLVPCFFALVVGVAYEALRFRALSLMREPIRKGTVFVQDLALVSVQICGITRSAPLSPFNPDDPSLAAGLPFFTYDYMRCWGRDIFITLRGALMATGRFEVAKSHILSFAMTLKHGLIPNLLGGGKEPRYNARDAAWWFLQSIQDYVKLAPDGASILDCKVKRRFPLDDTYITWNDPKAYSYETSIRDVFYEVLARHAGGLHFREANAGTRIDMQMRDEGFNIDVDVDWNTGLIHGGNQFNCGTWMDKMGESERAGSKGIPGTPRDGADVEIIGLLASALRFAIEMNEKGLFPQTTVKKADGTEISLKSWRQLLLDNFEKCFWVPEDPSEDGDYYVDSNIINRRGIYKDIFRSGKPYEDYQLRSNFPVALTVAPELCKPEHLLKAVEMADEILAGPVGMKTLDPSDLNYRPYYNNSEDSTDFATSKGRNYHQGPEWVWEWGYFLRAYRMAHKNYSPACKRSEHLHQLMAARFKGDREWLKGSPWAGVPELTNKDGEYCKDSCTTQAWSASCLLDVYLDEWLEEQRES